MSGNRFDRPWIRWALLLISALLTWALIGLFGGPVWPVLVSRAPSHAWLAGEPYLPKTIWLAGRTIADPELGYRLSAYSGFLHQYPPDTRSSLPRLPGRAVAILSRWRLLDGEDLLVRPTRAGADGDLVLEIKDVGQVAPSHFAVLQHQPIDVRPAGEVVFSLLASATPPRSVELALNDPENLAVDGGDLLRQSAWQSEADRLHPLEPHPGPLAHRILAEAIWQVIDRHRLLGEDD